LKAAGDRRELKAAGDRRELKAAENRAGGHGFSRAESSCTSIGL
jgi:hypothetical protein